MNQTPVPVMQMYKQASKHKTINNTAYPAKPTITKSTIPEQNSLTRGTISHMIQKINKSPTIPEQNRLTRGTITH